MTTVDEASRIKNYRTQRSQNVYRVGGWSDYRLILTGTPVTQGLQDLYGEFRFLNDQIVDCKNYTVFKNKYCVMGGFKGKTILGYQFQEDLYEKLKPYVDYVTKEQCLDLPEKITPPCIMVKPTENQARVMKQLKNEYAMQDGDHEIEVSTVLERMMRYQQVIGGTFPYEETGEYKTKAIPGGNPKLDAMMEWIGDLPDTAKVIIWARFRPEIRYIVEVLENEYGEETISQFHGGNVETRNEEAKTFKSEPHRRFMVSNQSVGGYGQTWVAATFVYYYSNSFSYEDRRQSEDRAHRKGQVNHVTYQDCEMNVPQDKMILKAIRRKHDLAMEVEEALS